MLEPRLMVVTDVQPANADAPMDVTAGRFSVFDRLLAMAVQL